MLTVKNSRNHHQAKASIRARAAALKLSLAAAFRARRSGEVTDQPQSASLPEASPAERRGDAFPAGGVVPQDVGRGHPGNPDRADAGHWRAPRREYEMGRHEIFENAAPIAEVMLAGTILGLPTMATDVDVGLVAAAADLKRLEAAIAAIPTVPGQDIEEVPEYAALDAQADRALDVIANTPATHLRGLRAKAAAVLSDRLAVQSPEALEMAQSLARDLLAFSADGLAEKNPDGDAILLQLGRQFEVAYKREIDAYEACSAAQDAADRHMPERPAALLFRASDHPLRLRKLLTHPDTLEGEEVTADDVAWMKRKPYVREVRRSVRPEDNLPADAHTVVEAHPWPEAQDRANEIVTAWDAWRAERDEIQDEYVTPELDDAANAAGDAAAALAQHIANLPARTAAGFRVKLQALSRYSSKALLADLPDLPDPDQILSHSLWRDAHGETVPAIEPKGVLAPAVEPSPVFVAIADGTRSAADDALSDTRVTPDLRKAVEEHRDATLAMLLETDESNEASNARCSVVEQTGISLRAVPSQSLADVRCKLAFLLPEILPDVNGSVPTAFLENIREDVDRLAQQPVPAPIGTSLVSQIDFASGTMEDLRSLRDIANSVADVAYAMAWTGRCKARGHGDHYNAAGKLMQWLGEALADVADEARKEAQRRRPKTPSERGTRLTILVGPTIENGDPDEITAFAGEMGAHVVAELAGR